METTKNTKNTKKYIFFYYGMPIQKGIFLKSVPENWQDEVVNGTFSWGGYRAVNIDEYAEQILTTKNKKQIKP